MGKRKTPKAVRKWFQEVGREGGKKGGKLGGERRRNNLTPERRSEIARRAAQARWANRRPSQPGDV